MWPAASRGAARQRLPAELIPQLTRGVGSDLQQQADERWLWKGRSVKIVDGSTTTMPDTPASTGFCRAA